MLVPLIGKNAEMWGEYFMHSLPPPHSWFRASPLLLLLRLLGWRLYGGERGRGGGQVNEVRPPHITPSTITHLQMYLCNHHSFPILHHHHCHHLLLLLFLLRHHREMHLTPRFPPQLPKYLLSPPLGRRFPGGSWRKSIWWQNNINTNTNTTTTTTDLEPPGS